MIGTLSLLVLAPAPLGIILLRLLTLGREAKAIVANPLLLLRLVELGRDHSTPDISADVVDLRGPLH